MTNVYIFTLPTCAPCNTLKKDIADHAEWFDQNNVVLNLVDASSIDDYSVDLSTKFNVRSAPTTVVLKDDGGVYYNGANCKSFDKLSQVVMEAKGF